MREERECGFWSFVAKTATLGSPDRLVVVEENDLGIESFKSTGSKFPVVEVGATSYPLKWVEGGK